MTTNSILGTLEAWLEESPEQSDGQLLERFLGGDGVALETLVRRHAPMVWGVCRRTLGRQDDAEDAFQATFLVLFRKASSIRHRERLANWLYGVASQTARKARQTAIKRDSREKQVKTMPEPVMEPPDETYPPDLRARLDEELSRLPEKYRTAIVLCQLQGRTLRHVAEQLRVPEGTVGSRLARGKKMLAERLTRRGLGVSATSVAAVWSEQASGAVPDALLTRTIKAVGLMAAGQTVTTGLLSTKASRLTEGVLRAMAAAKWKAAGVVLVLAALAMGAGALAYHILPDPPSNAKQPEAERNAKQPPAERNGSRADRDPDPDKYGAAVGASNFARTYAYDHFPFVSVVRCFSRPSKPTFDPKTHLWTLIGSYRMDSTFVPVREGNGPIKLVEGSYSWTWDWKLVLSYNSSTRGYEVKKAEGFDDTRRRSVDMDDCGKWLQGRFTKPKSSPTPVTALRLVVDAPNGKEYGLERNYSYGKEKLAVESRPRGVRVSIDDPGAGAGQVKRWTLQFGAATGHSLKTAEYGGARWCGPEPRWVTVGPLMEVSGWLDESKSKFGWVPAPGEFVVREIELQDQKVVRLAIDFISDSEYGLPCTDKRNWRRILYGSLRFNSRFQPSMPELDHDAAK